MLRCGVLGGFMARSWRRRECLVLDPKSEILVLGEGILHLH